MVITKVFGGLGNQMFQYAYGYRTAKANGAPLKMDLHGYRRFNDRAYQLDRFTLEYPDTDPHVPVWIRVCESRAVNKLLRMLHIRKIKLFGFVYVLESEMDFSSAYIADNDGENVYLSGYWQSPKYFGPYASALRQNFTCKSDCLAGLTATIAEMEQCNSVSVHIRRGDFLDPKNRFMLSGQAYYQKAIALVSERVEDPRFFVFTDDAPWVQANGEAFLGVPFTIVQAEAPDADVKEMFAMARAKHHINANSTFSWWAAWLCPSQCSVVVMPERDWDKSFLPEEWIAIPSMP